MLCDGCDLFSLLFHQQPSACLIALERLVNESDGGSQQRNSSKGIEMKSQPTKINPCVVGIMCSIFSCYDNNKKTDIIFHDDDDNQSFAP